MGQMINPETGQQEERLSSGFYRQLHEAYYDLDFHKMDLSQLIKKVRSLDEQLSRAKQEKGARMGPLLAKLPEALELDRSQSDSNTPIPAYGAFHRQVTPVEDTILEEWVAAAPSPLKCERYATAHL